MNLQNWFMGVAEAVDDPLGMGRIKVRCFGYHTPDRHILRTSDLPWASVLLPPTSPSVGGAGATAGIIAGSMVFGCFYDGSEMQDAVILGVFPGGTMTEINYDPINNVGFGSIGGIGGGFPFAADAFGNSGRSQGGVYGAAGGNHYSQHGFYDYPPPTFVPGGSNERLVQVALSQGAVRETQGNNRGPGIGKYWASTTYTGGYSDSAPWCAAFVCWVIQTAGIIPEEKRPKTALAFGFRNWAKKHPDIAAARTNPKQIYPGDIVIFSWSHIGIAISNSNGSHVRTIEGNTDVGGQSGVLERNRALSGITDAITIKSTGLQPLGGGPTAPDQLTLEEMMEGGQPRSNTGGGGGISLPEGGVLPPKGGSPLFPSSNNKQPTLEEKMEGGQPRSKFRPSVKDPYAGVNKYIT